MQRLDAHGLLAQQPDEELLEWFPEGMLIATHENLLLYAPLLITGGIALSGALDDAASLADLREAWDHFVTLLSSEIVTFAEWKVSTADVLEELELFARQFDHVDELN